MVHWNRRALLTLALVLVSLVTINFAVRGARHARHLRAGGDEPIQAWMNIRYIAHAYHVSPDVIHDALGLPSDQPDRRPLGRIAAAQNRPLTSVVADIMAAIDRVRAAPQPPKAPSPPAAPAEGQQAAP